MQCPDSLTEEVLEFAASVVPDAVPVYVDCSPLKAKPVCECFPIVAEYVEKHGGVRELGWSIYMWPKVFIEAELHAVWRDLDGVRHDISPHQIPMKRILFLPDPAATYGETHQVNNRRKALSNDSNVKRFIDAANGIYAEENRGEFAKKDHFVTTPRWRKLQQEKLVCEMKLIQKYGPPPGTPALGAMGMKLLGKMFS
ncbi:MAG: hypothetical protein KDK97_03080 [Verrucomicrobiales bacterium]|nr:hypothetical protein [Verrucomicrobiales bacterium]MCP5557297.1 zinc chelation protein SecC [Verrucomicrobiaceae bacterium]